MNQESSPRLSETLSEEQKLTVELAGFTNISMKTEALGLCRCFLRRKWISPDGFAEVVRVIGMFGIQTRWAPRMEAAVARQSARIRRALQGTMLFFYGARCDWKNALRFASMRHDLLPHEIAFAIEVFARAGRVREVRRLGMRIDRWIDQIYSKRRAVDAIYDLGFLWYGIGIYKTLDFYAKEGWPREEAREDAIRSWSAVPADHPLGPASGYNAIDLRLCMTLEKVNDRIKYIEDMGRGKFSDTELSLPGNQEKLNAQMLARFNRCRRALKRLVPEKRRKELGMDCPTSEA